MRLGPPLGHLEHQKKSLEHVIAAFVPYLCGAERISRGCHRLRNGLLGPFGTRRKTWEAGCTCSTKSDLSCYLCLRYERKSVLHSEPLLSLEYFKRLYCRSQASPCLWCGPKAPSNSLVHLGLEGFLRFCLWASCVDCVRSV